jgi:hypothetical protein
MKLGLDPSVDLKTVDKGGKGTGDSLALRSMIFAFV